MKFERVLQDTQAPEWKKAYIDYRGLKTRIEDIQAAQETSNPLPDSIDVYPDFPSARSSISDAPRADVLAETRRSSTLASAKSSGPDLRISPDTPDSEGLGNEKEVRKSLKRMFSKNNVNGLTRIISRKRSASPRPSTHVVSPPHPLFPTVSPSERSFFYALDAELEKVESFYLEQEAAMRSRSFVLKAQLIELSGHRKAFHAANVSDLKSWASKLVSLVKLGLPSLASNKRINDPEAQDGSKWERPTSVLSQHVKGGEYGGKEGNGEKWGQGLVNSKSMEQWQGSADPEAYSTARQKLKKAMIEHYRGLETLNNYRLLNLTGFQKALKKFEKVTGIPAQDVYLEAKVEPSALSSGEPITELMQEMEEIFADQFTHGNKKKARARLRAGAPVRSRHSSTFRTGTLLGVALPLLIIGIYFTFQQETRSAIPEWEALLVVYGAIFIPVMLALLIGVNLWVWSKSRVNYVFILELDSRTKLDYQEYFEIPALLLSALCFAFFLSFARVGTSHIASTTWPLVWCGFTVIIMFFPFPVLFKRSRYWLNASLGGLFLAGIKRVDFTHFWMGDQFCSLTFTFSNLYFAGCAYRYNFVGAGAKCNATSKGWAVSFLFAALPLFVRVAHSVRRYYDFRGDYRAVIHLVNGGKYGAGIVAYFFYTLWNHNDHALRGWSLTLYCSFAVIHSTYAGIWDVYMDWSFFRRHTKYPLLRKDLVYRNHIPLYYVAIVTNTAIRFAWIIYFSNRGPSGAVKTFIVALLEMFRRWQWNFYRLENEHLGNIDQYRVTRDVPLPYTLDDRRKENDEDEDEDPFRPSGVIWIGRNSALSSRRSSAQTNFTGESSVDHSISPPPGYQRD